MPVNTASAAIHITPVVIKTFLEHYRRKTQQTVKYVAAQDGDYEEHANDELMFDEAFHIVKAFIELGTQNSIESLQAFTNTYIPAPYWVAVAPVLIPFKTCNRAADVLIDWFGPDDLVKVVGGERWWQVRGLDGLEGEWVTEKSFLSESLKEQGKKQPTDTLVTQMEHLEPVMLYVHGGGYFFGSINTHRFQIIRYAKKLKGRAFTVNYRKAPQYPWPCPLHDVLSAYFYLIDPPPDSPHKPVSPSKIVLAGDSAGGALCLTALTVLRDMGIPLPAGAVLISPWVDLTHSFPSVMSNTKTDIIPNGGFVYKPSTLWPIQPYADADHPRVRETKTSPPPQPGHADTLNPGPERIQEQRELLKAAEQDWSPLQEAHMRKGSELPVKPQKEMQRESPSGNSSRENQAPLKCEQRSSESGPGDSANEADVGSWEPKPPKVLMEDPDAVPLELLSQIQQYATNEQLTHPLVSPVLQGSLCNLPPLYIIAGNNEALRDEIVYLAHRAAHPTDYPVRSGVLKDSRRQRENIEKFTTPTKVHLQVCDDMPHVLTVFTFIESATYAYRSIAQFARHVTGHSAEHIARNPFPEFHRPECRSHMDKKLLQHDMGADSVHGGGCCGCGPFHKQKTKLEDLEEDIAGVDRFVANERTAAREVETQGVDALPGKASEAIDAMKANEGDLHAQTEDIPHILMIRERVNIHGRVRPMEPPEDIIALQIRPGEIGIIKEAPVRRWHTAQQTVDRKFEKSARRITKNRRRIEERVARMLKEAREEGLILVQDSADLREQFASRRDRNTSGSSGTKVDADADHQDGDGAGLSRSKQKKTVRVASAESLVSAHTVSSSVRIDEHRRYGPLDLDDEHPPPSAIAGRRDTLEALALIKKHVYHTAPATHLTVPKLTAGSTIRAAFDPWNKASAKPNQSVSERQVRTSINPMHGLKIWNSLLSYFSRKAVTAAGDAVNSITARVDDATDAIVNTRSDPGRVQTRSHDQSQQP